MLGVLVESEAGLVLTGSLERAVEQSEEGTTLRGMSADPTLGDPKQPHPTRARPALSGLVPVSPIGFLNVFSLLFR